MTGQARRAGEDHEAMMRTLAEAEEDWVPDVARGLLGRRTAGGRTRIRDAGDVAERRTRDRAEDSAQDAERFGGWAQELLRICAELEELRTAAVSSARAQLSRLTGPAPRRRSR